MKIAILAGGDSSEHGISVKSAAEIQKWLSASGHHAEIVIVRGMDWHVKQGKEKVPFDKESFGFKSGNRKVTFDYAWNIIHGTPGENGLIQGYLDMLKIPYNCSGPLSSALTFNKYVAKNYLKQFGIMTAESEMIQKGKHYDLEAIIEQVGLPSFVKPNNGGSSFGTSKVTQAEQMKHAIDIAFKEDSQVIIESYVKGREITCGLMKTAKGEHIFPLTEIVPKNDFFDYSAKYEGQSEEITPAALDEEMSKRIMALSSEIYDHTQCRGIVRVDFIIRGNQIYFLELNTIPGMSKESIIPQQVKAAGHRVEEILMEVIEDTAE